MELGVRMIQRVRDNHKTEGEKNGLKGRKNEYQLKTRERQLMSGRDATDQIAKLGKLMIELELSSLQI